MTKPVLVLLPGLICDAALWAHQEAGLADVADVVVPDLTRHDSMAALARSVLETVPGRFSLAGLSMGGYVALEILRQAPERIDRLALLDTSARADTERQARRRRGLIALSGRGRFKGVTPRLLPQLVHPSRLADQALTDTILAMAARVGRDGFINQQKAILARVDSRALLPAVRCPTLVMCGRDDVLTPPELAEEMTDLIPGAVLRLIDACGHLPALEQPEIVTKALRGWIEHHTLD